MTTIHLLRVTDTKDVTSSYYMQSADGSWAGIGKGTWQDCLDFAKAITREVEMAGNHILQTFIDVTM